MCFLYVFFVSLNVKVCVCLMQNCLTCPCFSLCIFYVLCGSVFVCVLYVYDMCLYVFFVSLNVKVCVCLMQNCLTCPCFSLCIFYVLCGSVLYVFCMCMICVFSMFLFLSLNVKSVCVCLIQNSSRVRVFSLYFLCFVLFCFVCVFVCV